MMTDGAADEAPRFPQPLASAVSIFKEFELDALVHGVNAAGLSAFNPVERRMAPLSHDLAGIILPHDHYGNHLNSDRTTQLMLNLRRRTSTKLQKSSARFGQKQSLMGIGFIVNLYVQAVK